MSESQVRPIVEIEHHSPEALIANLRKVTMLKAPDVHVYGQASITLECVRTEHIYPPQRYALSSELMKVRDLRWRLREHGYDLFKLDGYLTITFEDSEPIDVIPPVVEESMEADGSVVYVINDGLHRMFLARTEWVMPQVILVRGVPKDCPYYAFPLREGWAGVEIIDQLSPTFIKKWHRIADNKKLYRNFNSAFNNIGAPRGKGEVKA